MFLLPGEALLDIKGEAHKSWNGGYTHILPAEVSEAEGGNSPNTTVWLDS